MQTYSWNELPAHEKEDRVQRVVAGQNMTVLQQRLLPNMKPNPHSHSWEQMSIVLAGKAKFSCMGKEVVMGPGGVVVFPPNEEHCTELVDGEELFVEEIFAPGVDRLNDMAPWKP
jgi:quercetin dioxygenase-like cupin family protein